MMRGRSAATEERSITRTAEHRYDIMPIMNTPGGKLTFSARSSVSREFRGLVHHTKSDYMLRRALNRDDYAEDGVDFAPTRDDVCSP